MAYPIAQIHSVTMSPVCCCALMHAFLRNSSEAREWSLIGGQSEIFYKIFRDTRAQSFICSGATASIYRSFITAELKRLGREPARFLCCHRISDHAAALRELRGQFPRRH